MGQVFITDLNMYLKMFPSLTMCTELRTLNTGSYAPDFPDNFLVAASQV